MTIKLTVIAILCVVGGLISIIPIGYIKHPIARTSRCNRCCMPWSHYEEWRKEINGTTHIYRFPVEGATYIPKQEGVEGHGTLYTESSGCFPLCEKCWEKLTPKQRLPYYRKLWNQWGSDNDTWKDIEKAVAEGK